MPKTLLPASEGQLVWLGGLGVQFKLDGTDTQGAFSFEYGLTYLMEQIPALIAKYGLRSPGQ